MKILAIDTTTSMLCVGARDGAKDMEYNLLLERKHSGLCAATVLRIISALGWQPRQIDFFACGLGPGSFTGIRIGVAFVKGLAWSMQKPVAGVPSLDVLAMNAWDKRLQFDEGTCPGISQEVVAVSDARRNLVYACIYRRKAGSLRRVSEYMLLPPQELLKRVRQGSIIIGDGVPFCLQCPGFSGKRLLVADKDSWRLQSRHLLALAAERISRRELVDAIRIKPVYLYPKDCQVSKNRKDHRP